MLARLYKYFIKLWKLIDRRQKKCNIFSVM